MSRVSVTIENHIAHVTLTREDKMNAMDVPMAEAIVEAGTSLIDTEARAVVLHGAGRAFCAGLDVMSFSTFAANDPEGFVMPRTHGDGNVMQEVAMVWRKVPVPVIAALHGVTFGAGLQLAMGADIRIAAPDTRLAIMEMKWGLVPDMSGLAIWPHLIRSDVLRRLTYTADEILAPQAQEWGLVTELSDTPLEAAQALAATIAGKSPSATRAAKRLINDTETAMLPPAPVLLQESREQADLIGKPDQMEVIAANMQKRAPNFG